MPVRIFDTVLLNLVLVPLLIFNASLFDGFQADRVFKVSIAGLLGATAIAASVWFEFFFIDGNEDTTVISINKYMRFSLASMGGNGLRILGIFLCKQTLATLFSKDACKAVMFTIKPVLSW